MPKRTLLLDSSAFELTDESCSSDSSDDFIILPHPKDHGEPSATAMRGWTPIRTQTPTQPTTPTITQRITSPPSSIAPKKSQVVKAKFPSQVKSEGESSASPPSKKVKRADKADKKGTKTRWNADEDALLISMMEDVISQHLWDRVKAEGSLVHRTGYGCKYHALLRQGTGKPPGKN